MRWLLIVGLAFDVAGAAVIAWPIVYARRWELREEGTMRLGRNAWVIVARTREQRLVRMGVIVLGLGFLCQLVAYLVLLKGAATIASAVLGTFLLIALAVFIATRLANRDLPQYADVPTRPDRIEDVRDMYRVRDLTDVPLFWRVAAGQELTSRDDAVDAYVSHGRWVANCPCGGGMAASPHLGEVACTDCATLRPLRVPDEWRVIEQILLARPQKQNQNWLPGETVEKLRAENIAEGVPPLFVGGSVP